MHATNLSLWPQKIKPKLQLTSWLRPKKAEKPLIAYLASFRVLRWGVGGCSARHPKVYGSFLPPLLHLPAPPCNIFTLWTPFLFAHPLSPPQRPSAHRCARLTTPPPTSSLERV